MVELVGIKEPFVNKEGKVVGYILKIGEELEEELKERLSRGERLVKVVFDPFEPYIQHLKENKIVKVDRYHKVAVVEITQNFKRFDGLIGISKLFYKIEQNESINSVIHLLFREDKTCR